MSRLCEIRRASRRRLILASVTVFILFLFLPSPLAVSASAKTPSPNPFGAGSKIHAPVTLTSPYVHLAGYFAYSIATSSKFVVVGAPGEFVDKHPDAGHAYVYNATNASLLRNFSSPNEQQGGQFGDAVGVSGDLVVVGAWGEYADGQAGGGRAYVFNITSGALVNNFTSPNSQYAGNFGESVAISGDTIAVGAPGEDGSVGRAYTFNALTGALIHNFTNPDSWGLFGYSVALNNRFLAVGAYGEDSYAGYAYVFNPYSGALICNLSDPSKQGLYFGIAVALYGKLVIVGAGSYAYVFNINNATEALFTFNSPSRQPGTFGSALSMSAGLAVVGAFWQVNRGYAHAGEAYVYSLKTGALVYKLTSPNVQKGGWFGFSVSITGNLLAVGAPQETGDGHGLAGHAYVYYLH